MITMRNWIVESTVHDSLIGYERDHLARRLEISTDLGPEWALKLDLERDGKKNVVDLEREGDVLYVDLTRDMLAGDGHYRAQLRGLSGEVVRHSSVFWLVVSNSINAIDSFPPLEPTEMAQMEERVTKAKEEAVAAASHPPKLSERRTWLVWDLETGEYSDTGVAATSVMEVPVTLAASGWTGSGPWEQVVSVPGLTEHGEIGPANSLTEEQRAAVRNAMLSVSGKDMTSETLTVVADGEKPALDIPAIVFLWG